MSISMWLRSPALRRGIALSAVVLATGGLVLHRSSASALPDLGPRTPIAVAQGKNAATFKGPGAHGVVALSHTSVLSGEDTRLYAEVRLAADDTDGIVARAPISMAVVIDTSGSMSGDKIEDAKRSVLRLLGDMRDDDEISVVRYSDHSELLQPLARVGAVRASLSTRIRELSSGGGTNIPSGLSSGLRALDEAARGRVRRIVLVSDGLDGTRVQAESLARRGFASGVTVSSLGVGLDFDESYMGAIAQHGHGNFAFVNDGSSIAAFLKRELVETASTTIEAATVRIRLPDGVRFVSAAGADASVRGDEVELVLGSLFAGDERRVVLELDADGSQLHAATFATRASWRRVGSSDTTTVSAAPLSLVASRDAADVERGRDGAVHASATSVTASRRQLEAADAYAKGDLARADALTAENTRVLRQAMAVAPAPAASALEAQIGEVERSRSGFRAFAPSSAEGKAAAKAAVAKEQGNMSRRAY